MVSGNELFYSENISLSGRLLQSLETTYFHMLMCLGPVSLLDGRNPQALGLNGSSVRDGYGISLTTSVRRQRCVRFELAVLFVWRWQTTGMQYSVRWNLDWPRIVSWDHQSIRLALCGDVEGMKRQLSTDRTTTSVALPNGQTLLHVCAEELEWPSSSLIM